MRTRDMCGGCEGMGAGGTNPALGISRLITVGNDTFVWLLTALSPF